MFDIAYHSCGHSVQLKDVSHRQNISLGYLEQILQDLSAAELVMGQRGRGGGYTLSRDAEEISVLDILTATGADIRFADCEEGTVQSCRDTMTCDIYECCVAREMWHDISSVIRNYFSNITLQDLCDKAQRRGLSKDKIHPAECTF